MTGCGLNEAYTFSIVSPKVFDQIDIPEDSPLRRTIVISNPMGEDFSILRTTTIPEMLKSLSVNNNRKIPEARLFELAHVYIPVDGQQLPDERQTLPWGCTVVVLTSWNSKAVWNNCFPIWELKKPNSGQKQITHFPSRKNSKALCLENGEKRIVVF